MVVSATRELEIEDIPEPELTDDTVIVDSKLSVIVREPVGIWNGSDARVKATRRRRKPQIAPLRVRLVTLALISILSGCTDGKERADNREKSLTGWDLAAKYRFNESRRWFRNAAAKSEGRALRMARYGEALALLNAIPKTNGNIERAEAIFTDLARGPQDDAITPRAMYHHGRIQQIHLRVPDLGKASAIYREMISRWPEEMFTQMAIVKLATIQLYEPTSPEEKRRRYTELAALEDLLRFAPPRRDFHYVMGVACLSLELSKERALYHLIACEDAGITLPVIRINTYCRIGVTAKQLGRYELAAAYFRKFMEASPRDPRTQMIKDHIAELPPEARVSALREG